MSTSGLFYLEKKAEINGLYGGIGALGGAGLGYLYNRLFTSKPNELAKHMLIGAGTGGAAGLLGVDPLLKYIAKTEKDEKKRKSDEQGYDLRALTDDVLTYGGLAGAAGSLYGKHHINNSFKSELKNINAEMDAILDNARKDYANSAFSLENQKNYVDNAALNLKHHKPNITPQEFKKLQDDLVAGKQNLASMKADYNINKMRYENPDLIVSGNKQYATLNSRKKEIEDALKGNYDGVGIGGPGVSNWVKRQLHSKGNYIAGASTLMAAAGLADAWARRSSREDTSVW